MIGAAFTVLNTLGAKFMEKIYENALVLELRARRSGGRATTARAGQLSRHRDGEYVVDLMVEHTWLVELKSAKALDEVHRPQRRNYLKATGLNLCLLLNFSNPKLEIRRIVHGL